MNKEKNTTPDDYVSNLKPRVNTTHKILILVGLIVFALIALKLSSLQTKIAWWSDLWTNISAGSFGSIITIFFIDYLINKQRTSKLVAVNKMNHYGFLSTVRIQMINIMELFGYISKKEKVDYLENAEDKFNSFLNDPKLSKKLDDMEKLNKKNLSFIKKLNKMLKKNWKYMGKNIKDFKPYPDPVLVHKIDTEMAYNSGLASVGEELFGFYYNELPKKVGEKEVKKMHPGMSVLWKLVSQGLENPEQSYKNYYMNSFGLLIELVERCKKENVFFDI